MKQIEDRPMVLNDSTNQNNPQGVLERWTGPIPDTQITITNQAFLKGLFGDDWRRVHVNAFREVVDHAGPGAWQGSYASTRVGDWICNLEDWQANQFYTVSLFGDLGDGKARRSRSFFQEQRVLVIDDVGEVGALGAKAGVDVLEGRLAPSFIVESSEGNYQIGYIFKVGQKDADLMSRLVESMIRDGLGLDKDPGMKSISRIVRLPNGINNKQKYGVGGWQCRLRLWEPGRQYTVEEIISGWDLKLDPPRNGTGSRWAGGDQVNWSGSGKGGGNGEANFVMRVLERGGLLGYSQNNGYIQCVCPNESAHTIHDGRTGFSPEEGFSCFHGSCQDLSTKDLISWLKREYSTVWNEIREEVHPREEFNAEEVFAGYIQKPGPIGIVGGTDVDGVGAGAGVGVGSFKEVLGQLLARARSLTNSDGLLEEIEDILLAGKNLNNAVALGQVMHEISETGFATKTELKDLLKQRKRDSRLNRVNAQVGGALADAWVFVVPLCKFYHVEKKIGTSIAGFNQCESGDMTLDGAPLPASHTFKEQGGRNVDGLTWKPCRMNEVSDQLLYYHGRLMLNVYEPPDPLIPNGDGSRVRLWWELMMHLVPNLEERNAFVQHMAATIQEPGRKINWQILFQGAMGIGKDALIKPMMRYFRGAAREVSKEDLDQGWGDYKAKRKLLVFSEVWRPRDRQFANSIKTMAADTSGGLDAINMKGGSIIEQPNLYSIIAMSNHEDALHLEHGERRWFVIEAFDVEVLPQRFYREYFAWLEAGGWQDVIAWLMSIDLSRFSWDRLPFHTEASQKLREAGRSTSMQYLHDLMKARDFPFNGDLISLGQVEAFLLTSNLFNQGGKKAVNRQILAKDLVEIGCIPVKKRGRRTARVRGKKVQHTTPHLYTLDDVEKFRQMSEAELYDYCPKELFVNSYKKFDENGQIRENQENSDSGETRH
jgi:hypothetical protein